MGFKGIESHTSTILVRLCQQLVFGVFFVEPPALDETVAKYPRIF